jgi:hypothetical protein
MLEQIFLSRFAALRAPARAADPQGEASTTRNFPVASGFDDGRNMAAVGKGG